MQHFFSIIGKDINPESLLNTAMSESAIGLLEDQTTYEIFEDEDDNQVLGKQYQPVESVETVTTAVEQVELQEPVQEPVTEKVQEPVQSQPQQPVQNQVKSGQVQGFQLVQATGLTDTSTPAPKGSEIPHFATATPIPATPMPSDVAKNVLPPTEAPLPFSEPKQFSNPLTDNSKSKQFTARTDYMISEFFSRQVKRLTRGAPEALDRSYR